MLKLRVWQVICLQMVPLFLFLSCDWSETKLQRGEENADGKIIFSVHENGKRETREYDKENRKFARSEKHRSAFHTSALCRSWGERAKERRAHLHAYSPLMPTNPACLASAWFSEKLYIFNWLKVPYGTEAFSLCVIYLVSRCPSQTIGSPHSVLRKCDKNSQCEPCREVSK